MKQNETNPKHQVEQQPEETPYQITPQQSTSIIASTIIGVGVLTLPRTAASAHEAAWIVTLASGLVALFAIWLITRLTQRFPGKTVIEFLPDVLASRRRRIIAKIICAPFTLTFISFWILATVTAARTFGEVIVTAILQTTPLEVIIGTMLLGTFFLVWNKTEVLARFNELVFPLIIIPGLLIAIASFQNARLYNLLPLWTTDWGTILQSVFTTIFAYQGFSVMLLFTAYTQKKAKITGANLLGVGIPIFVYALVVFAGMSVFGHEELLLLVWPTLELVKTTEFPGLVFERMESLFLGIWVAAVYTTVGNLYYSASMALAQCLPFRQKNRARRGIALLLLPLMYMLALQPRNISQLFHWTHLLGYLGVVVGILIPIFLYLIAMIRKKGKERSDDDQESDRSANREETPIEE